MVGDDRKNDLIFGSKVNEVNTCGYKRTESDGS